MHAKFMEFGRFGVRQFNVIPEDEVLIFIQKIQEF
jgi:hypothetical protein